jgi:3D-(3,5/4)-trihydroxycyclohexane-1,2-dione acylhydrolase (decyclizing)
VTIALHQDVQGEAFDCPTRFLERRVWPVTRRAPVASEIERAAELVRAARRPLVIAGGGVRYSEAEDALRSFAGELGIPVAETSAGKGSLVASDWLVGGIGVNGTRVANELARDADLVVCVGTRLSDFTTGSHSLFQHADVRFVAVNVNAADAHKLSAAPVVADAREALDALREALTGWTAPGGNIGAAVARWAADLDDDIAAVDGERLGQGEVLRVINRSVKAGDWVVAAAGWQPGDLLKLWTAPPGSFTHIEFAFSCMGHEIPAGIGIRLHEGDDPEVVVVIGDGTYLMGPTELVTAVEEGLKLTVVVLDNAGYRSIARLADGASPGNVFEAPVDYVANARSMGCQAVLAATADELRDALAAARDGEDTTVIVCPTEPGRSLLSSGAFWDLGVPEVAGDESMRRRTADHVEARAAQRYLG